MAGHFDAAPLPAHRATAVDDEGAALYAAHLPAIHVFHFHDTEQGANRLVRVGKQIERESHLRLEAFMRLEAVARQTVDGATEPGTSRVQVAKSLAFRGAPGRVVFRVKVEDQRASQRG